MKYISFLVYFIFNILLMDILITNTQVQDTTAPMSDTKQEDNNTQLEVKTPVMAVTRDSSRNSDFHWVYTDAPDSAGIRHTIKVSDKIINVTPTIRHVLGPESDTEIHILASTLNQY